MRVYRLIICLCLIPWCVSWSDNKKRKFKPDFLFGATTLAYQIEGAWDEDGKSGSVWDRACHNNNPQHVGIDTAADSYNKYEEDVKMLRQLGVNFYKFSIAWSCILPMGYDFYINERGLKYYDNLIDELLKYNIEPIVTMHDFDTPMFLQQQGSWLNPKMVKWFREYAEILFKRFAHKVKRWTTVDRPDYCYDMYATGSLVLKSETGIHDYMCIRHTLLAHAEVYRLYEKKYKKKFGGEVGFSMTINWLDPHTRENEEHKKATEIAREFMIGMFLNPILVNGDFPDLVKSIVAENSQKQNLAQSRLPKFNKQEMAMLKGAADFISVNHYTTMLVRPRNKKKGDIPIKLVFREGWEHTTIPSLRVVPYGLYKMCLYLNEKYNYPRILIGQNGISTSSGLEDLARVRFYKQYLKSVLIAIEDGTNLIGYSAYSLLDGYPRRNRDEHFGLFEVDFDSEDKRRTPRDSAFYYKKVIETRELNEDWQYTNKERKLRISSGKLAMEEMEDKTELDNKNGNVDNRTGDENKAEETNDISTENTESYEKVENKKGTTKKTKGSNGNTKKKTVNDEKTKQSGKGETVIDYNNNIKAGITRGPFDVGDGTQIEFFQIEIDDNALDQLRKSKSDDMKFFDRVEL